MIIKIKIDNILESKIKQLEEDNKTLKEELMKTYRKLRLLKLKERMRLDVDLRKNIQHKKHIVLSKDVWLVN